MQPRDEHGHAGEARCRRSNHAKHQQRFDWQVGEAEYAVERVAEPSSQPSTRCALRDGRVVRRVRTRGEIPARREARSGSCSLLSVRAVDRAPAALQPNTSIPLRGMSFTTNRRYSRQNHSDAACDSHASARPVRWPKTTSASPFFSSLWNSSTSSGGSCKSAAIAAKNWTSSVLKPGRDRGKRSKVSTQLDQLAANRPGGKSLPQDLERRVRTSIDDEHNFQRIRHSRGERFELAKEPRKIRLVLVDRNDQDSIARL